MLISGKSLGVVMSGLLLAATLVVLNLPTRGQAEESADATNEHLATENREKDLDTDASRAVMDSVDNLFSEAVPFVVGASRFGDGDRITITAVYGPTSRFTPGGAYWIDGTYTLASRDRASLLASVTARNAGDGRTSIARGQTMFVKRGSGTFTLKLPMPYDGWPHVSFYPAGGGEGFGGVYFGTGDSVLKHWRDVYGSNGTRSAESNAKVDRVRFPSLEDQKLADLAWRAMGLELEPIGTDDLKRVKALGYEGGLRVAAGATGMNGGVIQTGDILVGLHVWPMKSLKDVAEVLNRDDLAELNPLKFYAIHAISVTADGTRVDGGSFGAKTEWKDTIITGRISVSDPDRRTAQPALNRSQPLVVDSQASRYSAPQPAASSTYGSQPVVAQEAADIAKPQALAMSKSSANARSVLDMMEARRHDREGSVLLILEQLNILRHEREQLLALERSAGLKPESAATAAIKSKLAKQDARIADLTAKAEELAHASQQSTNESSEDPHVQQSQNPDNQSNLLYDGKTFDQWRTAWQTELSTEKRLEVVKALAAFGANGYGKEAAEAIVEIAGQYDWISISNKAMEPLQLACIAAFVASYGEVAAVHHVPSDAALPVLLSAVDSDNRQQRLFLIYVLGNFDNPRTREALLKLSRDQDSQIRNYATNALKGRATESDGKDAKPLGTERR